MSSDLTRRKFIGLAATGLALAACKSRKKEDVPPGPHPGAPIEGDTPLPPAQTTAEHMPMRPLRDTGAMVSLVGLGGFHIGLPSKRSRNPADPYSARSWRHFLDNCWDYHGGQERGADGQGPREGGYRQMVRS